MTETQGPPPPLQPFAGATARPRARLARAAVGALAVVGGLSMVGAIAAGLALSAAVRRGFSTREAPSALEALAARTARHLSMRDAAAVQNPLRASPAVLDAARAHWADHCAACHANDGSGETELGRNLYPRSPDLRAAATQSLSDGELFAIIKNGVRLTGMPAWGGERDDGSETWALVHFIRHLPALSVEERQQMERLNPRGPGELEEEREEENFLDPAGGGPPPTSHGHSP